MVLKVFSVYDMVSKAFMAPWYAVNRGMAGRSMTEAMKDANSNLSKYPQDHILFELGEFDDSTGQILVHAQPERLGLAADFAPRSSSIQEVSQA